MDYGLSDSSGTDDDFPPPHQNKFRSGGPGGSSGNGRTMAVGPGPPRIQNDMETQIHLIEQEAYTSVLRAFKAQSDAITWEMETLITDLRKELRVSDEEHRILLSRVNGDDIIKRIREWRKTNGVQLQPTSSSQKKQKTSQSGPSSSLAPPPHHPMPPSSSAMNRGGSGSGLRGKKPQSFGSSSFNSRDQVGKKGGGGYNGNGVDEDKSSDPLIGRKVWTRWPEDSNFYEAVITDFNPVEGRHALVYDANTPNEAWEWVNLREISPNDIRWKWEDVGASHRGGGRSGTGRGNKNPPAAAARGETAGGGSGRGRVVSKGQSKKESQPQPPPLTKGVPKRALNDLELLHTDTLVKEMDKVFSSSNADPMDIEKARKVLKEHEEALVDAIAKLEGASDGESEQVQKQSVRKHEGGEGGSGNKVLLAVEDLQTNVA
ncbi:hypothetical protein Lser_V15G29187 [Lactuca serriola]